MAVPILYSQQDCPYSLRARLLVLFTGLTVELREVNPVRPPSNVPRVPLLQLPSGKVLNGSRPIMRWLLALRPDARLWPHGRLRQRSIEQLIDINDGVFAAALWCHRADPAQLAAAGPGADVSMYLAQLEARVARTGWLTGRDQTLADLAIAPFLHHFAAVDRAWFQASPYRALRAWLDAYAQQPFWQQAVAPVPVWLPGSEPRLLALPEVAAARH